MSPDKFLSAKLRSNKLFQSILSGGLSASAGLCLAILPWVPAFSSPASEHFSAGIAFAKKGENSKAVMEFDEAIKLSGGHYAEAFRRRANAYAELEQYDKAFADYEKALQIDPGFYTVYGSRAHTYYLLGQFDKACADLEAVIKFNPNFANAYNERGRIFLKEKKYEAAVTDFDRALALAPKSPGTRGYRILALEKLGRYEEVIKDYNFILNDDDKQIHAYENRGIAYLCSGMPDKAASDLRKYLTLSAWTDDDTVYGVICCYFAYKLAGRTGECDALMEEADSRLIEKHWPYPVFQYVNGKLDAQELLDLASDNNRLTEAQCYIGMQEMINNNKQEALKSFRWVAHHGNKSLPEYNLSAANLMHLTKQTLLSSR